MATATRKVATAGSGGAYVEEVYEDTTNIVSRVNWVNNLDVPVRCSVTVDGTVFIDTTLAAHTSGSRNLSGPNRFNWETADISVNLAT